MSETAHKVRAIDLDTNQADEFAERYQALDANPYRSTFTYGRKKIEELIERTIAGTSGRALDAGCGTGFNLQRLHARGFTVTGLEPSGAMRAFAKQNNPRAEVLDGDIERMPFADATFDLVLSIEVIRYLADPLQAMREMARVTKPGGLAIITAAPLLSLNGYALINQVTSRFHVPTFTYIKHSFLTANGAEALARHAGFARSEVHGAFIGPWHGVGRFSPSFLASILQTLEPIDNLIADLPLLRDLSNHLIIIAHR